MTPNLPVYLRWRDCEALADRLGYTRYTFRQLMAEVPRVYPRGAHRTDGRRRRAHYRRDDVLRALDPIGEPLLPS